MLGRCISPQQNQNPLGNPVQHRNQTKHMKQQHSVTIDELGITISTGSLARLANGSVTISKGETTVFVSATAAEELRSPDQDFFPLTVDYREKFAAAGRFPGGYFRREGKPSDKEILTSRLCDRPLRPLFLQGVREAILCLQREKETARRP